MHWARIGETSFLGGMRFLHWVYRHGGRRVFRFFLIFPIGWYFLFNGLARRSSLEYLERLHETSGGATPAPTWRNALRHFYCFGETLLDKVLAVDVREQTPDLTRAEGLEAFHSAIDAGRGALIVTAHFGNLLLLRRIGRGHRRHVRITLLIHTRHAERFQRILDSLDPGRGIDLMQVDSLDISGAMALSERIAAGGIVAITGDRVPVTERGATTTAPFLGRDAQFPVGPYVLAAALGCPVFMMFSARTDDGFSVSIDLLADPLVLPRKEREAAIRRHLGLFVATLTRECQKHPFQWFNFYPFWGSPESER